VGRGRGGELADWLPGWSLAAGACLCPTLCCALQTQNDTSELSRRYGSRWLGAFTVISMVFITGSWQAGACVKSHGPRGAVWATMQSEQQIAMLLALMDRTAGVREGK
jgi:hypothetical protein